MPVFSGNTSTSALSTVYNNPVKIKSFNITNKTGVAININVSVLYGSTNIWLTELDKQVAAGAFYENNKEILIRSGSRIYVLVNGSADYYFTLEETT